MPRFTVLHAERQDVQNGKEWEKDPEVTKYKEMLIQAGFEAAISHVIRAESWRAGPSLRELMLGNSKLVDRKPFYANRRLSERLEEAAGTQERQ